MDDIVVLSIRQQPRSKLTDPLFPVTTVFRDVQGVERQYPPAARSQGSDAGRTGEVAPTGDPSPSRHRATPSAAAAVQGPGPQRRARRAPRPECEGATRSEEHTSELQSLMRISYAVFCLKKKKPQKNPYKNHRHNPNNTGNRTQLNTPQR